MGEGQKGRQEQSNRSKRKIGCSANIHKGKFMKSIQSFSILRNISTKILVRESFAKPEYLQASGITSTRMSKAEPGIPDWASPGEAAPVSGSGHGNFP